MLQADTEKKIKAVCVVHNETTTGVTSDIPEARRPRAAAAAARSAIPACFSAQKTRRGTPGWEAAPGGLGPLWGLACSCRSCRAWHRPPVLVSLPCDQPSRPAPRLLQVRKTLDAAGHPALLLVDGVSSIGALDFEFDQWRVDVAVTGSQKALSIPTGLAMVCASDKALAAMKTATSRCACCCSSRCCWLACCRCSTSLPPAAACHAARPAMHGVFKSLRCHGLPNGQRRPPRPAARVAEAL